MDEDYRLERFAWLIKISEALTMIRNVVNYRAGPLSMETKAPQQRLHLGLLILCAVVQGQMKNPTYAGNIREGSRTNWYQQRLMHGYATDNYDPHQGSPSEEPESLPEDCKLTVKPVVNDALRNSRYALLRSIKVVLYLCQDDGMSVQTTIKVLWGHFRIMLNSNIFIAKWMMGKPPAYWSTITKQDDDDFIEKLDIGERGILQWSHPSTCPQVDSADVPSSHESRNSLHSNLVELHKPYLQQKLGWELRRFLVRTRSILRVAGGQIVHKGYLETLTDPDSWYDLVANDDSLYDDECPVCFQKYQHASEAENTDLPGRHTHKTPVILPCGHILCLPCFKEWTSNRAGNFDKCPVCRGLLPPPNRHEEYLQEAQIELARLIEQSESGALPQDVAKTALRIVDLYLARLPQSVSSTERIAATTAAQNVADWRCVIETPVTQSNPLEVLLLTWHHHSDDDFLLGNIVHLRLSRDRLQAYLERDQDLLNDTHKKQIHLLAFISRLDYCRAVRKWDEGHTRARLEEVERELREAREALAQLHL